MSGESMGAKTEARNYEQFLWIGFNRQWHKSSECSACLTSLGVSFQDCCEGSPTDSEFGNRLNLFSGPTGVEWLNIFTLIRKDWSSVAELIGIVLEVLVCRVDI